MERKDLKPVEEMLLNLYNDNHEHKIKLEKVKEFWVEVNSVLSVRTMMRKVCSLDMLTTLWILP